MSEKIHPQYLFRISMADYKRKYHWDDQSIAQFLNCHTHLEKGQYYFDIRKQCYKDLFTSPKPSKAEGLGDVVEQVTEKLGIKQAIEKAEKKFNFDCGCHRRKKWLNEIFPFNRSM